MSDKFGCDRCFDQDAELYCCEHCDGLFCIACEEPHEHEEHKYPINKWKKGSAVQGVR